MRYARIAVVRRLLATGAVVAVGIQPALAAPPAKPPVHPSLSHVAPMELLPTLDLREDPLVTVVLDDAKVGDVIKVLTKQAGLHLIADSPRLDKTLGHIDLHDVPLSQCFTFILRMGGLVGRRFNDTLYVTDESTLKERGLNDPSVKNFRLANGKVDEVSATLTKILRPDTKVITDVRTNTVMVIGAKEDIALAEKVVPTLDKALAQVMIDVKLVGVTKAVGQQLGLSYGFGQGKFGGAFGNAPATAAGTTTATTGGTGSGTEANNVGNPVAGDGQVVLTFNALGDITANFNARLNALVRDSKAKILTNPRVAAQDNFKATIEIADQVPIIETNFAGAGGAGGPAGGVVTQTVTFRPIGEILNITPHIDPTNGWVTLELEPEISNRGREVLVNGNPVPEIQRRKVKTVMRVRDGESIVIGGLTRRNTSEARSRIPFLGDLPFLGSLFTNTTNAEDETELMIVVTPHIMTDSPTGVPAGS